MKLLSDWPTVLRHAWSVRWIVAAGIFSALELILPALDGWIPHGPCAIAAGICSGAAFVSRLLAQRIPRETDGTSS